MIAWLPRNQDFRVWVVGFFYVMKLKEFKMSDKDLMRSNDIFLHYFLGLLISFIQGIALVNRTNNKIRRVK